LAYTDLTTDRAKTVARNLAYTTRAPRPAAPGPPAYAAITVVEDALRSHYAKEVEGI